MTLRLDIVEGAKSEDEEGYWDQQHLLKVFEELLILQERKSHLYGSTWHEQGFMGNIARVLSKCSRLKTMLWRDFQVTDSEETVEDTLLDMMNLGAFTLLNWRAGNKWGK